LAPENEHVLMVSPASNPAAVASHRLFQRPVNGTPTLDLQSPAAEAYRVFVVADFEPANVDASLRRDRSLSPLPTPRGAAVAAAVARLARRTRLRVGSRVTLG
jgi:hypothetical protein